MNVVFLSVDALRPDHLGCYGYEKSTSPQIDRLANRARVFENAMSTAPGTKLAFKPLFTGRYPQEFDSVLGIPEIGESTLAEIFADAGYATGGFHSNGFLSREFNYDRGFDAFYGPDTWPDKPRKIARLKKRIRRRISDYDSVYKAASLLYDAWMESNLSTGEDPRTYRTAEEVNEVVFDWLDGIDDDFFLWVHYMDVHEPYIFRQEYLEDVAENPLTEAEFRRVRSPSKLINEDGECTDRELENIFALYDAEIRYVDEHVGRLLDRIEEEGDTLLIFTADHGESFGEMRGKFHVQMPHWNMVNVPLIINGPGISSARTIANVPHIDLPSTLLNRVDIDVPDHFGWGDLLSKADASEPIFIEYLADRQPGYACIADGWKYVLEIAENEQQLYNLDSDPKEKNNVIAEHPEIVARFSEHLEAHRRHNVGGLNYTRHDGVSAPVKNNLRELGYLDG